MHAVTTSIRKRWEFICTPNTNISKLSEAIPTVQKRNFIVENIIYTEKNTAENFTDSANLQS